MANYSYNISKPWSSGRGRCYGSRSAYVQAITISLSFVLGAIVASLNFIVLCAIWRNPRKNLRKPSSLLIANLITSDFITGLVYCNLAGTNTFLRADRDCSLSTTVAVFRAIILFVNNFTITSMSFDRLLAVSRPLDYRHLVTNRRTMLLILAIWILAAGMCVPVAGISKESEEIFEKFVYPHSHISLPLVLLTTTYICIFRKLKRQREILRQRELGVSSQPINNIQEKRRIERDSRLTWTIILVMASFWLSALPYFISLNILTMESKGNRPVLYTWLFAARFVMINAAIDPILLTTRLPNIRLAVSIFLRRGGRARSAVGPSSVRSVTTEDETGHAHLGPHRARQETRRASVAPNTNTESSLTK